MEKEDKAKTIRHTPFSSCWCLYCSCVSALTHLNAAPTTSSSVQRPQLLILSLLPCPCKLSNPDLCSFFPHTTPRLHTILPYKYIQYDVTLGLDCSYLFLLIFVSDSSSVLLITSTLTLPFVFAFVTEVRAGLSPPKKVHLSVFAYQVHEPVFSWWP